MSRKKWCVSEIDKELAGDISEEFDLDPFCSLLLTSRGIVDDGEIHDFFSNSCYLSDPFEIQDMDKAVERIKTAIIQNEKILVYGDYDADGVTSTAILYLYLKSENADVSYYIPNRNSEGYGLNLDAVKEIYENGVKLIVTVDNGVSAFNEAEYISSLGMDLVVTDHHKPSSVLPKAVAVVDPHREDSIGSFKLWAGVGVAFKLISALSKKSSDELLDEYSDLVAIGTIGDIVPLIGENRALVKRGLQKINKNPRLGISSIMSIAGTAGKSVNAASVAFSICPRINAVGRIGEADCAVKLLLGEDVSDCEALSGEIDEANTIRQDIEKEILLEAEKEIERNPSMLSERILIFCGENWHAGVIGIVASRFVQKYGKPCIVIAVDGDTAKGSGRSVEGFSLFNAVSSASHFLERYGGHPLAAGFSLKRENLENFKAQLFSYAKSVEMPFYKNVLDLKLNPAFITADILDVISSLEPFGAGNPQPLFGLYNMTLSSVSPIGNGKHLRLSLKRNDSFLSAVYFGVAREEFPYEAGDVIDIAAKLERNEYMGQTSVSINIKDVRMSGTDDDRYLKSVRLYEKMKLGERITEKQAKFLLPKREEIANLFRFLRNNGGWKGDFDVLCYRLSSDGSDACRIFVSCDILEELGILKRNGTKISLADTKSKVDLENSNLMQKLINLSKGEGEYSE